MWSRRKWLGLAVFGGALAASLSAIAALPSVYRATATVLVDREQVPEAFVKSPVSAEVEARLSTISQELLSRNRIENLVARFDLYPELRRKGDHEAILAQMRKDIVLEPKAVDQSGGKPTTISFAISYRGNDPNTVAAVTNALASSYVEQNSRIRERQATGTAQFLKTQLADMKRRLDEQEHHMGALPAPPETELAALERLNVRLRFNNDQQLRLLDRRDRLVRDAFDASRAAPGVPGIPGAPDPTAAKLAKMKQDLAELRTHYTDKYPDVIKLRSEIAALEAIAPPKTDKPEHAPAAGAPPHPARNVVAEVDAELKALRDEERGLRASIATYEARVANAPQRQQEYQRQARDYATTKEMYASLLKRYEDAQIAESMEQAQRSEQFRVLDPAVPPKDPVAPHRMRLMAMALALSAGLAFGAVMLAERLDTSFHTIDDLRGFTRVPVLTGIAPLLTDRDAAQRRRRACLTALSVMAGIALVTTASYFFAHGNELLARLAAVGGQ
jgi:polysaccharide chain length determinant protein (PEP-CTERM system associated)